MGVHGLWDLLAPVGRRVSVETLAGKRLAIDASIWMIQFMKAMRDERGEMVRNAHILGFFRRICKLLFLRTKPVFVFDGGTPALKRRTVIARRRQRENAQAKIRKTAEKLLLNHVKAMKLKELADNLRDQRDDKSSKGKEVLLDQSDTLETNKATSKGHNQEIIDEMLAASIQAEESGLSCAAEIGSSSVNASTSTFSKEDEDDEDEEMILSVTDGDVDPAVLAALPPSMQLDLLVQMRERLMAENRQKYQKVKQAPQKFSELQIEAYLKTVAFRREIDQVQKAASGKGVGGVQTSRIASESNREFIFSSSFSGDKQLLTPGEAQKLSDEQPTTGKKDSSFSILNIMSSTNKSNIESTKDDDQAVQTFLDERGRKRVSRGNAMGIRMTRDLQRNIDLLKELEQEKRTLSIEENSQTCSVMDTDSQKSPCDGKFFETLNESNCDSIVNSSLERENHGNTLNSEKCININISFDDDGVNNSLDGDDEFFAHLVAGKQSPTCLTDNSSSECDWEDGIIGGESGNKLETNSTNSYHPQNEYKYESNVEWEEGSSIISEKSDIKSFDEEKSKSKAIVMDEPALLTDTCQKASLISSGTEKIVSKGIAEEEAALQEAIRRSLEDTQAKENYSSVSSSHIERVLDETHQPQSTLDGSGQSNFQAGKDTLSLKSDETLKDSEDHSKQKKGNNTENNGTSQAKNMAACISSGTDDVRNELENSPRKVNESFVEQTSSGLERSTIYGVSETNLRKDDNDERSQEDNNLEPLGSSLEDELLVLDREHKLLGDEQRKLERNADSVNAEMFVECQELLQMFGLPYIIAPMEAEAQCAYMELAGLVDGVVTDDSDVFLFGGQSVYKNIFDDRKYVETYLMKDIESELGLNREKLIRMALLLGSDYTEGVSGIGIVNAIEVVNAFPEEDGFHKFREWIESPDPAILGKIGGQPGSSSKKKGSKSSKKAIENSQNDMKGHSGVDPDTLLENDDNDTMSDISSIKLAFMNKHRNVSKNWHIPASFPSDAVISAYKAPQVDKSTEPFSWGKPDIFSLRRLCWEKFAWASQKADELLLPVLKEYNKHETQLRLEAFYTFNERFAKIRSKRIQKAVKGITGKQSFDEADDLQENPTNKKAKSPANNKKKSLSNKKQNMGEKRNLAEKQSTDVGSKVERKRRKGKAVGRGKAKDDSDIELNQTSSSDYNSNDEHEHEQEVLSKNLESAYSVRRSKRPRKAASYVEKDEENDEVLKNSTGKKYNDIADEQELPDLSSFHKVDDTKACSENDIPDQVLSGDYLIKGGGFCTQEGEEEEPVSNNPGPFLNVDTTRDSSSEYLQMGGGFCLNEDEPVYQERDSSHSPINTEGEVAGRAVDPNVTVMEKRVLDRVEGLQKEGTSNLKLNVEDEQHETIEDSTNKAQKSVNPFSAIPFMKRKRRKT